MSLEQWRILSRSGEKMNDYFYVGAMPVQKIRKYEATQ
jgi:hypothetical protein